MRSRFLTERPDNFRMRYDHPLAQDLVLAGLGGSAGSSIYYDSSPHSKNGNLINMDPGIDWIWDDQLKRFALDLDGSNDCVKVPYGKTMPVVAISAWEKSGTTGSTGNVLVTQTQGTWTWEVQVSDSDYNYFKWGSGQLTYVSTANYQWRHWFCQGATSFSELWVNGILRDSSILLNSTTNTYSFGIGQRYSNSLSCKKMIVADVCIWTRLFSPAEIQQLANPTNVMLSGMLEPPKRRLFNITRQIGTPYRRQRLILGTGSRILNLGV